MSNNNGRNFTNSVLWPRKKSRQCGNGPLLYAFFNKTYIDIFISFIRWVCTNALALLLEKHYIHDTRFFLQTKWQMNMLWLEIYSKFNESKLESITFNDVEDMYVQFEMKILQIGVLPHNLSIIRQTPQIDHGI